jgi:hypothetical protein
MIALALHYGFVHDFAMGPNQSHLVWFGQLWEDDEFVYGFDDHRINSEGWDP